MVFVTFFVDFEAKKRHMCWKVDKGWSVEAKQIGGVSTTLPGEQGASSQGEFGWATCVYNVHL